MDEIELVVNRHRITGWPATVVILATLFGLMAGPAKQREAA